MIDSFTSRFNILFKLSRGCQKIRFQSLVYLHIQIWTSEKAAAVIHHDFLRYWPRNL